jgi:CubicO group peptidase (beta-lactamase class C family)
MTRLVKFLALLFMITAPQPAAAQEAAGRWSGVLQVSDTTALRLIVTISVTKTGEVFGTLDVPMQGVVGLPLANLQTADRTVSFDVPAVAGRYQGRWNATAENWAGTWSQGGASLPLNLSLAAPLSPPPPLPGSWAIPDSNRVRDLIDQRMTGRDGAGMIVGIIEDGRRRFVTGGPAGAAPFDRDTLFEIGSISKLFTATLLSIMITEGKVALHDPVTRYFRDGAQAFAQGDRQITLGHLATHSSGLPSIPDNLLRDRPANPYAGYDEQRLVDFLGRYRLTRKPGFQFEYSNFAAGLLGQALTRRAATSYEELVRRRIALPLGMSDTAVTLTPSQQARLAQALDAQMRPVSTWDFDALAGAGALRSTAGDLLTFLSAAMGDGPPDLSAAMREMTKVRSPGPSPGVEMALGWMVIKAGAGPIYFHSGGTGGYRSAIAFDPERRRGVVVLTNAAAEPSASDIAVHLLAGGPLTQTQPEAP